MKFKFSPDEALSKLMKEQEFPFTTILRHGSMTIEYFSPREVDTQTPHKQDEIYMVIKGHSSFYRDREKVSCRKGDILFVPAGVEHHFENFSDDFAVWVIFYGPEGGESHVN